jgi:hypothetical protein
MPTATISASALRFAAESANGRLLLIITVGVVASGGGQVARAVDRVPDVMCFDTVEMIVRGPVVQPQSPGISWFQLTYAVVSE